MTSTASSSSSSSTAFSFLYLDDHEDVVSVVQNCRLQCLHRRDCYEKKTKGSVWITTHALFFEPSSEEEEEDGATRFLVLGDGDAFSAGEGKKLVKIKYEDAIGPSIELSRIERNAVDISSEKVVLIAENEPREIVRDATVVWRISMDGEGEDDVAVEQRLRTPVNKLLNISKQKNRQTKCEQLAFLSRQREGNLRFDEKNLKLDGERSRFEAPAAKISPLVRRAGRVRVTDAHLYFQPLIVRDSKAKKT